MDLLPLFKRVTTLLGLSTDAVADHAKASATVVKILRTLTTMVQGLAELRSPPGPPPTRLFVGSGYGARQLPSLISAPKGRYLMTTASPLFSAQGVREALAVTTRPTAGRTASGDRRPRARGRPRWPGRPAQHGHDPL